MSEPSSEPIGQSGETGDPRARRRLRWQVVLVALLLSLVALRVALPVIAESLLEEIVSDKLQVAFVVDNVDLGFLEGEVAVEGVSMRVAHADEDLARAGRIVLDADWGALLGGELRAERIAIEEPALFFELTEAGRLNWDALGGPEVEPQGTPQEEEPGGVFHISSTVIDIGTAVIHLVDHTPNGLPELAIGLGALHLEGFSLVRAQPGAPVRWSMQRAAAEDWRVGVTPLQREQLDFVLAAKAGPVDDAGLLPLELSLTRNDGLALTVNGSLAPDPLVLDLDVEWQGLSSRSVAPLLLRGAEVLSGTAQGSLRVSLDMAEGPDRGLRLSGSVRHDDLVLHVDNQPPIEIDIDRFEGELEEIWLPLPAEVPETPEPIRAVWKRIALYSPEIDLRLGGEVAEVAEDPEPAPEDGPPSPASAESEAPSDASPDPATEPPLLDLTIAEITLQDGRLSWHDPALGEHAEQTVSGVRFDARSFHWPPATIEHAKLEIASLGSKPFRIEGPLRADGAELKVRGSGIKLVPWNPLIMHYSDYKITGGSLSIRSDFTLKGESYDSPTKITLKRLGAMTDGSGFRSTFGIPLSTALSLLSDPAGNIDLELPVSGELGAGGELRVGVSLVDALREGIMNAITSVITSPFGAAGALLAKGTDLAFLRIGEAAFQPGVTTLDPAAIAELDRAAAFVAKSPDARLGLSAEIVSADLEAPGARARTSKLLGNMIRGVFGGRKKLDARSYTLGLQLAKARLQAAADHLVATGTLAPERIVQKEWDEKISDGSPRVVLRLDKTRDEED